jgi:hypothetical protein
MNDFYGKMIDFFKKKSIFLLIVLLLVALSDISVVESKESKLEYTVVWDNVEYNGTYEGELENSKPSGQGIFKADNEEFVYEGSWRKGKISGEGKISYKDGSYEVGIYSAGKRNGVCTLYNLDGSYQETRYKKNIPYGQSYKYVNDQLSAVEVYAGGETADSIKQEAVLLSLEMIQQETYTKQLVCVEGEVKNVAETEKGVYFRMLSESVGMVTGYYKNTESSVKQAIMPNMVEGDSVKIYGYYAGMSTSKIINDVDGYGTLNVAITPVYGELSSQSVDLQKQNYSDVVKDPYLFLNANVDGKYVMDQIVLKKENYYIKAHKQSKDDEIVYLSYASQSDKIISVGMVVDITGYYSGQYKEIDGDSQLQYLKDENEIKNFDEKNKTDYNEIILTYDYQLFPLIQVENMQ